MDQNFGINPSMDADYSHCRWLHTSGLLPVATKRFTRMINSGTIGSHEPSVDAAYILIVVLDGSQVDYGIAWENGYFYKGKSAGARIMGSEPISAMQGKVKARSECHD